MPTRVSTSYRLETRKAQHLKHNFDHQTLQVILFCPSLLGVPLPQTLNHGSDHRRICLPSSAHSRSMSVNRRRRSSLMCARTIRPQFSAPRCSMSVI